MKNADMPAMPVFDSSGCPSLYGDDGVEAKGLTKREMMAMHMFAGLLARDGKPDIQYEAGLAIKAADALLAELERTKWPTTTA